MHPVALVSVDGKMVHVNQPFLEVTGFPREALIGRSFSELATEPHRQPLEVVLNGVPRGTRRTAEAKLRLSGGRVSEVEIHSVPIIEAGAVIGAYEIVRDLTEQKRNEQELESRALHDHLTGLPNRVLFTDRLGHAMDRAHRLGGTVALLYIDLDRFKPINDREGHEAGDQMLRTMASRLQLSVRGGDSVARLGGDEFAVIIENVESKSGVLELTERILTAIRKPTVIDGKEQQVGASIGVAFSTPETESIAELVRQADLAMYEAKGRGGFSAQVFRSELEELQAHKKIQLEADLRDGVRRDELFLQYQPIVDAQEMEVVAFEVLVRWAHPTLGLLLPSTFIPLAEGSSLIADVDRWVLQRALHDLQALKRAGQLDDSVYVSVNLSGRHFEELDLVDAISNIILVSGFDPDLLQLEITESAAGGDLAKVRRLKALGVKVAIDDFGTGYSSLSYVRDLDVDVLKVDKSFVLGLGADPSAVAIIRTILTLADMLGLGVIIEGIEDATQLAQLKELGGRFIQGFLFGRPMDLEAIPDFLEAEVTLSEVQPATHLPELDGEALLQGPAPRGRCSRDVEAPGVKPYWPV